VVPESPTAQDSPAEKQQQPKDQDVEDKANEDADEVESFGVEAPVLADRLRALLEHLGITTTQVQDQGSPASQEGGVQSHHRDFLQIQSPLPTQGTSFQDLSQR
jgi:hypothetical protein